MMKMVVRRVVMVVAVIVVMVTVVILDAVVLALLVLAVMGCRGLAELLGLLLLLLLEVLLLVLLVLVMAIDLIGHRRGVMQCSRRRSALVQAVWCNANWLLLARLVLQPIWRVLHGHCCIDHVLLRVLTDMLRLSGSTCCCRRRSSGSRNTAPIHMVLILLLLLLLLVLLRLLLLVLLLLLLLVLLVLLLLVLVVARLDCLLLVVRYRRRDTRGCLERRSAWHGQRRLVDSRWVARRDNHSHLHGYVSRMLVMMVVVRMVWIVGMLVVVGIGIVRMVMVILVRVVHHDRGGRGQGTWQAMRNHLANWVIYFDRF